MSRAPIHYIDLRTFCYSTESFEKVKAAFNQVIPQDQEINIEEIEGNFGNEIKILKLRVKKSRKIRDLTNEIKSRINEDELKRLKSELPVRLDDNCSLFIRFNKQRAYKEDLELTDSGNAIVLRFKIAAYPAKREKALEIAKEIF
ncbi:MAG: Exosome subunit RNA binding protein with dsRBD fold [Candidatus Methanohalarchaeum thermophilum]|uniref:Exosome subunit RNA binding protein with dsRBD fold n=1 Tax=Methanohalarchaeum thermophilum TaxID=1903181 RepID=A0A1Q6DVA5_METT1|nr:MAG: Exosome subunit RNA binding protein with dsRBD fold [Candidatus Methanohalarchaeum thermophilum]